MKKFILFTAIAAASSLASAEGSIGVLKGVSGVVSVSGDQVVTRAISGTPVIDGSSIMVSSSGKATLLLNNGCTIQLQPNQHLMVDAAAGCDVLTASIKPLFPAYQVVQAPLGSGLAAPAAAGAGAAAGGAAAAGGITAGMVAAGVVGVVGVAAIANSSGSSSPVSGQ